MTSYFQTLHRAKTSEIDSKKNDQVKESDNGKSFPAVSFKSSNKAPVQYKDSEV